MSKKLVASLSILIFIVGLIVWAFNSSRDMTTSIKVTSNQQDIDNNSDNVTVDETVITETRDGQKFLEIYSKTANYDSSKSLALLEEVSGNFYKDSKVVLSFKSPNAVCNQKTKLVRLLNGAKAATNNILITSKEMYWTGNSKIITAVGNVKIHKGKELTTSSNTAVFNTDFTKFKIMGGTVTNVYVKSK